MGFRHPGSHHRPGHPPVSRPVRFEQNVRRKRRAGQASRAGRTVARCREAFAGYVERPQDLERMGGGEKPSQIRRQKGVVKKCRKIDKKHRKVGEKRRKNGEKRRSVS